MVSHYYINDIVDAIFERKNHRKLVLQEAERRILSNVDDLLTRIIEKRNEKDVNWWKNELIRKNPNKKEAIWFGGLNTKTIFNMAGSTATNICREVCAENYDAITALIEDLPRDFPKPTITISHKGKDYKLNPTDSFMLIRALMAMVKTITGGIWSEVGKNAGDEYLRRLFDKMGISEGELAGFSGTGMYHVLDVAEEGRKMDAVIYYRNSRVLGIEIKILGAGNPEIVDEAISRLGKGDVFLVDRITPLMRTKAEEEGITVFELKDAPEGLYNLLKGLDLPIQQPYT